MHVAVSNLSPVSIQIWPNRTRLSAVRLSCLYRKCYCKKNMWACLCTYTTGMCILYVCLSVFMCMCVCVSRPWCRRSWAARAWAWRQPAAGPPPRSGTTAPSLAPDSPPPPPPSAHGHADSAWPGCSGSTETGGLGGWWSSMSTHAWNLVLAISVSLVIH